MGKKKVRRRCNDQIKMGESIRNSNSDFFWREGCGQVGPTHTASTQSDFATCPVKNQNTRCCGPILDLIRSAPRLGFLHSAFGFVCLPPKLPNSPSLLQNLHLSNL